MKFTCVIGLEIHAELLTKTKIFCSCENKFGEKPNMLVCPVCSGMPGTLPDINKKAVELAVKAGLIFDCKINNYSSFDRKNYFYPDLPKAYQITQFYHPICENGYVEIENKKIRIERIHLEEDAGKLIHDEKQNISVIDYNRCGIPLIEIVTAPDFNSADEVEDFVREISLRLKYADICNSKFEQGSLRVDVNISVMEDGSKSLGTRAEIKNLNSIKSIKQAISYEFDRQTNLIINGKSVKCETRNFDEKSGKTYPMRKKERVGDYRYFPEPDLPNIYISDDEINKIKNYLPQMPCDRFIKYTNMYMLTAEDAKLLIEKKSISDFYDKAIEIYKSYKTIKNILLIEINRNLNDLQMSFEDIHFSPKDIAQLAKLYDENKITKQALSKIVMLMFNDSSSPIDIAQKHNLIMKDNKDVVNDIIKTVINNNTDAIIEFQNGNQKVFTYLMGKVMRIAGKSTNPNMVSELLGTYLNNLPKI